MIVRQRREIPADADGAFFIEETSANHEFCLHSSPPVSQGELSSFRGRSARRDRRPERFAKRP